MQQLSLGTIEVLGLPAAVEAADVACKTADVKLIGYETTDGMGMVAVKIEGQVSAVTSAVAAAAAAAARITKVFATSVIARPSDQLEPVVFTDVTVGLAKPAPAPKAADPVVELVETPVETPAPVEETLVELVETPVAESVAEASSLRQAQDRPSSAVVPAPVETPAPAEETVEMVVEPVETPVEPPAAAAPPKARATRRTSTPKPRTTRK